MGMLLRVVDENEVQAPIDARLSEDELDEIIEILGDEDEESPSAKRLENRLRERGGVYAWGIEEGDVYEDLIDGDPMVVAVGGDDKPSDYEIKYVDYEIKYVTELEFCLHEDVCENCGEEVAEAIGFDGDKYVAFSTIPPVSMSEVSGEEYTLEYLQKDTIEWGLGERKSNGILGHKYINNSVAEKELIGGITEYDKEGEFNIWVVPTGGNMEKEPPGGLWRGYDEFDSFYKSNIAYMAGRGEDRFTNEPEHGDIFIARQGKKNTYGFGLCQSNYYEEDEAELSVNRNYIRAVDWIIEVDKDGMLTESMTDGAQTYPGMSSSFTKCGLDKHNEDMINKYKHIKREVTGSSGVSRGEFERLEQRAKQKKALRKKLEEHRMKHNDNKEYRDLLKDEKQVLFYGPPGTGKTHKAEEIAEDYYDDRTEFITFHPSYSYEEFVQGIRPNMDGDDVSYDVEPGVFKKMCRKAAEDTDENNYLLVIDEINRGNISSIFGELITLLEPDKRGEDGIKVSLPYSNEEDGDDDDVWKDGFHVPGNLHIIGTMNTADRSIAKVDVALRRRFAHAPFEPDMNKARDKFSDDADDLVEESIDAIEEINRRLMKNHGIEAGKKIGHSYMMDVDDADEVVRTWKYEILPLLNEYFFDDYEDIAEVLDDRDEGNVVNTNMKKFVDDGDLKEVIKNLSDEE